MSANPMPCHAMQCVAFKACSAFFCVLSARGCKQAVEAFIAVRQGDGGMDPGKIVLNKKLRTAGVQTEAL